MEGKNENKRESEPHSSETKAQHLVEEDIRMKEEEDSEGEPELHSNEVEVQHSGEQDIKVEEEEEDSEEEPKLYSSEVEAQHSREEEIEVEEEDSEEEPELHSSNSSNVTLSLHSNESRTHHAGDEEVLVEESDGDVTMDDLFGEEDEADGNEIREPDNDMSSTSISSSAQEDSLNFSYTRSTSPIFGAGSGNEEQDNRTEDQSGRTEEQKPDSETSSSRVSSTQEDSLNFSYTRSASPILGEQGGVSEEHGDENEEVQVGGTEMQRSDSSTNSTRTSSSAQQDSLNFSYTRSTSPIFGAQDGNDGARQNNENEEVQNSGNEESQRSDSSTISTRISSSAHENEEGQSIENEEVQDDENEELQGSECSKTSTRTSSSSHEDC